MNIDLKKLSAKLSKLTRKVYHYRVIMFLLIVSLLYGWLIVRINLLSRQEPSEDTVTEKLQTIKRPVIDQSTVDKIQQLQDNSVDVQTLFKQARDNPFQE